MISLLSKNRIVPFAVLTAMAALTFLVWRQQVRHQRSLLINHTENVSFQASRRLEVFVESHLRVASLFARRWSTHESRDFSRERFEDFASVLMEEFPAYHGINLVGPGGSPVWSVPADAWVAKERTGAAFADLLKGPLPEGEAALSIPLEPEPGRVGFAAALPLVRDGENLGRLLVEFQADNLINDCFHTKIRSEFNFAVYDGPHVLFSSSPGVDLLGSDGRRVLASREFPAGDRTWRLLMVPRENRVESIGWTANLAIPLFGVVLSVGLSLLVYMLQRRMEMHRAAQDRQALLSRKVLIAQEEERARVSRELHDELGQTLTAIRLEMGWLEKRISADEEESDVFRNTARLVEQAADDLRRICRGLRPPLLDDLGLEPAVRLLVEEFSERTGLPAELDLDLEEEEVHPRQEVALCLYRILQESLNNIGRHAQANRVRVSLKAEQEGLLLSVTDDGVGFDPSERRPDQGCGLAGMRERATLVGGTVEISSSRGEGTTVIFRARAAAQDEGSTS